MTPDTTSTSEPVEDSGEIMASVDDDGSGQRLIIADVDGDDAWLSMRVADTASLAAWQ